MGTRRYKQGIDRQQVMLLPPSVNEYITEDNPVQAIDVYVNSLDMEALGFRYTSGGVTAGQPAYPPAALLKMYLYGYLNRIRSSRRLEREAQRNLEVIWLMQGLRPSYKTIADFRKDNLKPLKAVNRDFVQMCQELGLYGGELVGIDGSYFRGNVNKSQIYTEKRLKESLERLEKQIAAYLQELEEVDEEEARREKTEGDIQEKLEALKTRQAEHQERLAKLQASEETQLAEVDEDARLLSKNGQTVAGYNVQHVVDEKHKLLVACEATNAGNDQNQLEPMAKKAKQVLGVDELLALADAGYFDAKAIKACLEAGITPYVPEPDWNTRVREQGRFSREDFHYHAEEDCYKCPAGQLLKRIRSSLKNSKRIFGYASQASVCAQCPLKGQCLPEKTPYRQINRWEHEHILDAHRVRMKEQGKKRMQQRAALAEHPFGTLKLWCGWNHFLLRGKEKVDAEMNFLMLCYNFKRALNILGLEKFRAYCQKRVINYSQKPIFRPFEHALVDFSTLFSRFMALFVYPMGSSYAV